MLTALATFPLIFMGGLVTSHGAGMSVPDWPNSWGYNMFLLPPSKWLGEQAGGVFYEHTHRLLGTLAGFCSIALVLLALGPARVARTRRRIAVALWISLALSLLSLGAMFAIKATRWADSAIAASKPHLFVGFLGLAMVLAVAWLARVREERRFVRITAWVILAAVVFQGVLGGLRVVWANLDLAIIHGCFGQAFFCLCGYMVAITSKWWHRIPSAGGVVDPAPARAGSANPPTGRRITFALAVIALILVYAQLIAGAIMRHYQAGLAIPDLPLAYGKLVPPTDSTGLKQINDQRTWDYADRKLIPPRVTLWQVWAHFIHRIGAVLVTISVTALVVHVLQRREETLLRWPAWLLIALLLTQLTLGVLVVLWDKPADLTSFHVAFGALTLFTTFVILIRCARMNKRRRSTVDSTHPLASGCELRTA